MSKVKAMIKNVFKDKKPLIFTGITPTGRITVGHYLGVIKTLISLQESYNVIVMIADLHALTTVYEKKNNYSKLSREMAATLYACGLKKDKCKIFVQSKISSHLELSYFLSSYCSIGKLSNMIQYKEKLKSKNISSFLLLYYPILMASDIFLYNADLVVVGEDQKQHIEFAKYLASKFNSNNDNILKIPKFFIAKNGSRIMDLQDPLKKMSKTHDGSIFVLDKEDSIKKKIMKSKTDSDGKIFFDRKNKPGVSNLLVIYSSITNREIPDLVENFFLNKDYSFLKKEIIRELVLRLKPLDQKQKEALKTIDETLFENYESLKEIAAKKVELIKEKFFLWKTLK